MFGKKGFRNPKKENRAQRELREKSGNFIKDYEVVCKKHGLQLDARIEVTPGGIAPKIQILEYAPKPEFETKDWSEAQAENKEIRRKEAEKANK